MNKVKDHRGRPKENDEVLIKFKLKTKDHTGEEVEYKWDRDINPRGPISIEVTSVGEAHKPEILPKQIYDSTLPVVMVYKKSDRKNSKPIMKIWKTKNIDDVLTNEQAGIGKNAVVLELGVGNSLIEKYKSQYKL